MEEMVLSPLLGTVKGGVLIPPRTTPLKNLSRLPGGRGDRGLSWPHKAWTRLPKAWEVLGFWVLEENSIPRNEGLKH